MEKQDTTRACEFKEGDLLWVKKNVGRGYIPTRVTKVDYEPVVKDYMCVLVDARDGKGDDRYFYPEFRLLEYINLGYAKR